MSMDELQYELDLYEADIDEDFFDKIKKLGDAAVKAKEILSSFETIGSGNALEASVAVLSLFPDTKKELNSVIDKVEEILNPFKQHIDTIESESDCEQALSSMGGSKLTNVLESEDGEILRDFKAFIIKHAEKIKQAIQIIQEKDMEKVQKLVGFDFPDIIQRKAQPVITKLGDFVGPQADKIAGFVKLMGMLPTDTPGLAEVENVTESRNLYTVLPDSTLNEALTILAEEISEIGHGVLAIDTSSVDSYPLATIGGEGRMMDYGQSKSDSHAGRMSRAKLFRMGRMAQSLEARLMDDDDLPGWVQDKITTAEDRLKSVYDYMDYKLHRMKSGDIPITESKVRLLVRQRLLCN